MPKRPDPADRLVDAALRLAAQQGWRATTLTDIAGEAGLTLAEAYRAMPSKTAMLDAFARRIDAEVLGADAVEEDSERMRDRLFDVLMRRADALQPHRAAVAAIVRDAGRDPVAIAASLPQFLRSMRWMGEAAGLAMDGVTGMLRTKAIGWVWAATLRVWLKDDSPDLSRTMAALDRRLRWAERWTPLCGGDRRTGPRGEPPAAEESPAAS
jgi:AcrR family transcriptional regulator